MASMRCSSTQPMAISSTSSSRLLQTAGLMNTADLWRTAAAFFLRSTAGSVSEVGPDFPVFVKLNGSDNLEGGLDISDAVHAARLLDREKIDAIEVSGGTSASGDKGPVRTKIDKPEQEAYNLGLAREIRKAVNAQSWQ